MNAPFASIKASVSIADLDDARTCDALEDWVHSKQGTPFHRPAWLKAVERGTGQRALGLVTRRSGLISGWLPLTEIHSPFFGRALVSSGFGVEGGILAEAPEDTQALAGAARELAARKACNEIELRGGDTPDGWARIEGKHASFASPLAADDEAQLLAIPRKQRAEVRKGLGNGLVVATGKGEEDRAAHYAVYAESVRNLGTPVFPRTLFDAVLDAEELKADILTVSAGGAPVASVLSLYHEGAAMPYWGGGTRAARSLRANELMYYELMCHARRRGCERFDFGRSRVGGGPYRFKKNWGFEPQPLVYSRWASDTSELRDVDPASQAHSAKVELWKRVPLGISKRIGPVIARGLG